MIVGTATVVAAAAAGPGGETTMALRARLWAPMRGEGLLRRRW